MDAFEENLPDPEDRILDQIYDAEDWMSYLSDELYGSYESVRHYSADVLHGDVLSNMTFNDWCVYVTDINYVRANEFGSSDRPADIGLEYDERFRPEPRRSSGVSCTKSEWMAANRDEITALYSHGKRSVGDTFEIGDVRQFSEFCYSMSRRRFCRYC